MSKIEISNDTRVIRHRTPARISHWMLVICFFMTMFTGVAFFFPDFAWLTEILGTPQIARAVHPFTGILMFFAFIYLALVTGIIMWRQYFSHYFSIPVLRIAILLHSLSAFMLFTGILVHMYMAFWIKGSIRGIVEGWVTVRWAKKHHPKWYREEVLEALENDLINEKNDKGGKTKVLFKGFGK